MDAIFRDRQEAGRHLAVRLNEYLGTSPAVILGLPRGGVPVAFEVAQTLKLPLDVLPVRKLGVPGREELAFGAIASGGVCILNEEIVGSCELAHSEIQEIKAAQQSELERRERLYRDERPAIDLDDKDVVLVDDGLATGATMRAAIMAARHRGAGRVIVAIPVAPPQTCTDLERMADAVICLAEPEPFYSVGSCYEEFSQVSDEEVKALLQRAASDHTLTIK